MNEEISNGFLIVKASTASGAIPVEGATVIVQGKDENNSDIFISLLTNRDGLTDKVILRAPSSALSQSPFPIARPYSTYNIEVYKDGFYPQHYNGIPIFENVTAVQNARLIPISDNGANDPYYRGEQFFDEYENPFL